MDPELNLLRQGAGRPTRMDVSSSSVRAGVVAASALARRIVAASCPSELVSQPGAMLGAAYSPVQSFVMRVSLMLAFHTDETFIPSSPFSPLRDHSLVVCLSAAYLIRLNLAIACLELRHDIV
jgi:hypothetical protein